MFHFSLELPGLERWIEEIDRLEGSLTNLQPVLESVAHVVVAENADARLHGIGGDGQPLEPIKESTWKRRARARKGDGPPLDPDLFGSRVVTNFGYAITQLGFSSWQAVFGWEGIPWLRHHIDGTVHGTLGPRDVTGVNPAMHAAIEAAFREAVRELFDRGS